MDVSEENMSQKDMLEKIAELDFNQSQLRSLNAEMRHWLDVADDEMAVLRSENGTLRKQVTALEKLISEAPDDEAEPCRSLRVDDPDVNTCSEEKIHELEKESSMLKEKNKTLTAELKSLQQEKDQNQISLSNLRNALQTFKSDMEEAQLELQCRDEIIDQKNFQLQYLKENVDECSNIMKDLRLTNQELKLQLEDRLQDTSFAVLNEPTGENEGSISRPLSLAEEIKLLASSAEVKSSITDSTDVTQEETECEKLPTHQPPTAELQNKRCVESGETSVSVGLFMLCIFTLAVLAFGSCAGIFLSIDTLWSSGHLILQPYWDVQYRSLPPV